MSGRRFATKDGAEHGPRRSAATAGLLAGPLFVLVLALVTWLERDFLHGLGWTLLDAHGVPYPSGTALGPYGFIQIANFFLTGVLLLVFVRGLRRYLPDRRSARVAAVLIGGFGVAFLASAAPTDTEFGAMPSTWHGWMHAMAFLLILTLSVVAPLVTAVALRGEQRWSPLGSVSLAVGVVCPALLLIPSDVGFYALIVVIFAWCAGLAVRMGRLPASRASKIVT